MLDLENQQEEEIISPGAIGAPEREPEPGKEPADKKAAEVIDPLEFRRVQKEVKTLRGRVRESEESAQFWAEQAKAGGGTGKSAAEPDPEPEPDIDLVSEITTNGVKGLETVLARLGYAKRDDIHREIGATRAEITEQSRLLQEYPELGDEQSEFFQETAKVYNQLKTDPIMAKSPKLIAIAARMAKAEMGTPARRRAAPAAHAPDDDYEDDYREDPPPRDREAERVARQSGDRGRRSERTEPQVLDAGQKAIVRAFQAAGAPVTEESYAKRANAGIRMGGQAARRSR